MLLLCYLRKGAVYVPVLAKTEAGFYKWIEPITVTPVASAAALRDALKEVIARGNPIIPTPPPATTDPLPIALKQAGVKTWRAWERSTTCWKISENDSIYKIVGQKEGRHGGWVDDPEQTVTLLTGTPVDHLIDRVIGILQAAAE